MDENKENLHTLYVVDFQSKKLVFSVRVDFNKIPDIRLMEKIVVDILKEKSGVANG